MSCDFLTRDDVMPDCPCGSNESYQTCCEPFINGNETPATPEQLMRSRYSAYAQGKVEYIGDTMYGRASKDFNLEAAREWANTVKWMKLEVINSGMDGDKGHVEFIAHFHEGGKANALHELSEFAKKDGKWFYIDGRVPPVERLTRQEVGRNDPCPCGSGKKFKKCCL